MLSDNEKYYGNECYKIAQQAKLPLFWVRYVDCEILENSDYVYLWHSNNKKGTFERIQLREMIDKFAEYGIKAKLENGVLKIIVPKEEKPNNSITIEVE